MKKALWILSSLALVGFSFTACDDDETDACDNKCDEDAQICAPIKGGTHSCVAISKLNDGAHECYDNSSKAIKSGYFLEADGQDYRCTQNTTTTTTTCETDAQCTGDLKFCDVKAASPVCVASIDYYKYVRIDDMSTVANDKKKTSDPGADIDAVVLVKQDGSKATAQRVVAFKRGDDLSKDAGKVYAADSSKILGDPDSLINYGKSTAADTCYYYKENSKCAGNDKCNSSHSSYCGKAENAANCNLDNKDGADYLDFDYSFVSLGGTGGYIIVEMNKDIAAGDKLDIIELGNCHMTNTGSKKAADGFASDNPGAEDMEISISISGADQTFKALGTGKAGDGTNNTVKGVYSITVSETALAAAAKH